jgi:hypothetical protein
MALIDVVNALFRKSNKWNEISDDEKSLNFFIINRYMSKKYIKQSQLLNLKSIDKVLAMELWFHFMQKQPYPTWFWSKVVLLINLRFLIKIINYYYQS